MKLIILCLNTANKPSLISESVAEIRINSQPCKGINLTTRHTPAQRAPRVATIHDEVKETIRAHLTLVHVFHAYALADTPWVAHALSHYTPIRYGRIASVSVAHDATQWQRGHLDCSHHHHTAIEGHSGTFDHPDVPVVDRCTTTRYQAPPQVAASLSGGATSMIPRSVGERRA
jgi:hypothetical protein